MPARARAQDRVAVDAAVDTPAQNFVYELLQQAVGADAAARSNMNVDGSGTAVPFVYEVPTDLRFQFERFNVVILDGGNHTRTSFGAIAGPLDPGLALRVLDSSGNVKKDFTGGLNVRQNSDWKLLSGVDEGVTAAAGPNETGSRFTVGKAGDQMTLFAGEKIEALVQNDLDGLVEFRIHVQGILEPRRTADPK